VRYVVEHPMNGGGISGSVETYDAVKEPRDICIQLESQRGVYPWPFHFRTNEIRIPGEQIAGLIAEYHAAR
ncbi:MAG: hypothetical protein WAW96_01835, partial [Alphaproteobacteria bacterium]